MASASYTTDAPVLEILLGGQVISSEAITAQIASGSVLYSYSFSFEEGAFPSDFSFRFNDTSTETGRSLRIDEARINGYEITTQDYVYTGDTTVTANALALENGAAASFDASNVEFIFGLTEPTVADIGTFTITGTAANNADLVGTANHDVIYGDDGHDYITGLAGDDIILGGDGADTLFGHDGNDILVGGEGNDRLFGRNDDDILYGGNGHDKLEGDAGNDILNGGAGNDTIWAGTGDDVAYGGDGKDKIMGQDGSDTIYAGAGTDRVEGGNGDDFIDGGEDRDWLYGNEGNDTIDGGSGDDRVFGGNGEDVLNGGEGQDIIKGEDGNDIIDGGDQKDWLYGGAGDDVINGGAGKDRILGGADNDLLHGDGGDDILIGSEGDDTLNGGEGNDVLYASLDGVYTAAVTVASVLAADPQMFYNSTTGNFYKHITTGANDMTHATAVTDATTNTLHGATAYLATLSNGAEQTFVGTIINGSQWAWVSGSDSATEGVFTLDDGPESGTAFDASLSWQGGAISGTNSGTADNVLIWDGGGDVLYAYSGANTAYGYVAEWEGGDVLTAGGVTSGYDSTAEVNILNGGVGNDTLYGSMGNDILNGGADDDILDGGHGIDIATYAGATGGVSVDLGAGSASGAEGNDSLISIEHVIGSDHDDTLTGDSADNTLDGGAGTDTILGGGGSDILIGGAGNDIIGSNSVSGGATVASILAANSNLSYSSATGNFYEFVSGAADWNSANAAAQASTVNGVSGHLLTINSAAEQSYIGTIAVANSHFWSGGTDSGTEGEWEWTEGPEAGTEFWNGAGSTGEFTDWYQGDDTSNSGTNDHLLILNNGTYANQWYAYTSTYSAAYMIEWEGADIFAAGVSSNNTSNSVLLYGGDGQDTLYGGTGLDTFVFEATSAFNDIDVIENFVGGVGGDMLDLSDILAGASGSVTDLVSLLDDGNGNTLVQVDADGTANGANFQTVAQINGLTGLDEATLLADGNLIL